MFPCLTFALLAGVFILNRDERVQDGTAYATRGAYDMLSVDVRLGRGFGAMKHTIRSVE